MILNPKSQRFPFRAAELHQAASECVHIDLARARVFRLRERYQPRYDFRGAAGFGIQLLQAALDLRAVIGGGKGGG